jgi:MerR family transcriptional regulator/heat shock protein HspR
MTDRSRPLYMIGVVAEMVKIHPQTLRMYEKKGLIRPSRSEGKTRMYSPEDVEEIARVTRLANLPDPLVTRRLLAGRVSATREADRLRAEARVRWRELRAGRYPPWCVLFALRPRLALVLPAAARQAWRRLRARA